MESANSPVIRFYWGYSAKKGTEKKLRIPLRNLHAVDCWAPESTGEDGPWYWGGGPFQNGTNNLQQFWSHTGFKRHVFGFDLQHLNTEVDRQLQDAPPRTYYSHAAQRLADLVDEIRKSIHSTHYADVAQSGNDDRDGGDHCSARSARPMRCS